LGFFLNRSSVMTPTTSSLTLFTIGEDWLQALAAVAAAH